MYLSYINLFIVFLPIIIGFTFSYFGSASKTSGRYVNFRPPPPWVYGIILPIFYMILSKKIN